MEDIALSKEHLGTSTDKGSALRILSELPHPASVRWPHSQGGIIILQVLIRK